MWRIPSCRIQQPSRCHSMVPNSYVLISFIKQLLVFFMNPWTLTFQLVHTDLEVQSVKFLLAEKHLGRGQKAPAAPVLHRSALSLCLSLRSFCRSTSLKALVIFHPNHTNHADALLPGSDTLSAASCSPWAPTAACTSPSPSSGTDKQKHIHPTLKKKLPLI